MKRPSDNVVRVDFRSASASDRSHGNAEPRPAASENSEYPAEASSESFSAAAGTSRAVAEVIGFPERPPIDFDRIPAADPHARGFFTAMAESGLVTVLTLDAETPDARSYLESTEPLDGEAFRISLAEFVEWIHPGGRIDDPEELAEFAFRAFESFGAAVEFRQGEEYVEISRTSVTEETLPDFRPEAHPISGGTESGSFSYVEVSGESLPEAFGMELFPDDFLAPEKATLLDLLLYVRDGLRESGYEVPDDSRLTLLKRPYVREGSVTLPVRLLSRALSDAVARVSPIYANLSPEARIEKYFLARVLPNVAPIA